MVQKLSFTLLLLALGHVANGQLLKIGNCPSPSTPTSFEWGQYVGKWFEYAKYPFAFEVGQKCIAANYADAGNNTVSVHNTGVSKFSGKVKSIDGYAKILGPGSLAVVFSKGQSETKPNYQVVSTDYVNYAVVFSCSKLPVGRIEFLWILTRERQPSESTLAAAYKAIDDNKLSKTLLVKTNQSNCPA